MREISDGHPKKMVLVLIGIIIVLALLVVYAFVLRPSINGFAVKAYNGGAQDAVLAIMQQAAKCQQVPLTFGNQTINMIALECLKQAQQNTNSSR